MGTLWETAGHIVEESGELIECDDCPCGDDCSPCTGDAASFEFEVELSGFANNPFTGCNNCQFINAGYRATYEGSGCDWTWEDANGRLCNTGGVTSPVGFVSVGIFEEAGDIVLTVCVGGGCGYAFYRLVLQAGDLTPYDCSTIEDLDVPFNDGSGLDVCLESGSTCRVTAVAA